ncbi:MAG: CcoQ/FixQ family Cbb3-type cytochrome c oxidase assembly chaperone [Flavobacteriaceae bacterium]
MLRYVKHHLETLENVAIYPIVSLSIFVLFFTGLLFWTFKIKKKDLEDARQLPFDELK